MVILIAGAAIAAIYVVLGVVADLQTAGFVPVMIGEWTVGFGITFLINFIFWELLFVGIWLIPIVLIIYGVWYRNLPDRERKEYEGKHRRHKSAGEDGGFSFLVWLIWLAIVWIGGMWNLAFQAWTLDYWVYSWLGALLWALLIVGIPGLMYLIWSLTKKSKSNHRSKRTYSYGE